MDKRLRPLVFARYIVVSASSCPTICCLFKIPTRVNAYRSFQANCVSEMLESVGTFLSVPEPYHASYNGSNLSMANSGKWIPLLALQQLITDSCGFTRSLTATAE